MIVLFSFLPRLAASMPSISRSREGGTSSGVGTVLKLDGLADCFLRSGR